MADISQKNRDTIRLAAERLLTRATDQHGVTIDELEPRVTKAAEKYLLKDDPKAGTAAIDSFVSELRVDDICLILACERGDARAWDTLVQQFDQTVRSAARKTASNAEDADDLASSIWAELYGIRVDAAGERKSKLAYYSGRGSLGGWLRAIVAQLAIDAFRKTSRYVQVEEDRELEVLASNADTSNGNLISRSDDPESSLVASDMRRSLSLAIKCGVSDLEPEDRLIIKLYYFDGLKLKQIADTFGYHEATASRRLSRIQGDLRKSVEKRLRDEHGWTDTEITTELAETAAAMGLNVEKMFAAIAVFFVLQELWR